MGLGNAWKKIKVAHAASVERARQYEDAKDAIAQSNVPALQAVFAAVEDTKAFMVEHQEEFLRLAIKMKNMQVFTEVSVYGDNDPNATLYYSETRGAGRFSYLYQERTPLLIFAMEEGSEAIALDLAKNPKTDIEKKTWYGRDAWGKEPLELAETSGMTSVHVALLYRKAALLRDRAGAYEAKAKTIMDDLQGTTAQLRAMAPSSPR